MTKYTDKMVAELRELGTVDFEKATAFAEKHGISARSVAAKARALDIPYQAKIPGAKKAADKGPAKSDHVKAIETALGISVPSLAKMTVPDLAKMREAISGAA